MKHIDEVQKIREEKNLDHIAAAIKEIIGLYGVTVEETAAVLFSVMKDVLNEPHNQQKLKEFNVDINVTSKTANGVKTPLDKVTEIQKLYIKHYASQTVYKNSND
ncbi:hypothetical protein ACYSNR_04325 [Enterococcus sp. LJL128]